VVHPLKVTLENLYNGKTSKLAINRNVPPASSSMPLEPLQPCLLHMPALLRYVLPQHLKRT
jgi:hypothetical protein